MTSSPYQIVLVKAEKGHELCNAHIIVPSVWNNLKNGQNYVKYGKPPYDTDFKAALEEMVMTKMLPVPDDWPIFKCNPIEHAGDCLTLSNICRVCVL